MRKVSGQIDDFAYISEDESRIIIGYDLKQVEKTNIYEWYEIYFYKKQINSVNFQLVKDAIINDINIRTDYNILTGFIWKDINVYLSPENQRNFSEAQRMAEKYGDSVLPLRFKLGEDENENPVYYVFETIEDLDEFYNLAFSYVNTCLNNGWQIKDTINWEPYQEYFPEEDSK